MMLAFMLLFQAPASRAMLGSINYTTYTCPKGYDCMLQNSCPGLTVECSAGMWCGGDNIPAIMPAGDGVFATDRFCPTGIACATPAEAAICPEGKWCDEGSTVGADCAVGSICGEGTLIPITYIPLLTGILWFVIMYVVSRSCRTPTPNADREYTNVAPTGKPAERIFQQMSFKLDKVHVPGILAPINVEFNSGELTAIMGPSGAGKSTIMNTIMGVMPYKGELTVNGTDIRQLNIRSRIGFVPQDDIMEPMLSARELITYSAQCRLPASYTCAEITAKVDEVISSLGLWRVQHTPVGDEITRGISGGQKKRVSIGIELVANPSALFLDEPTSGLDASSAEEVTKILATLVKKGRCVLTVIHQPRYDSFARFNKLVLLSVEDNIGRLCFFGPALAAHSYFGKLDPVLVCPKNSNPANHILDVISGVFDHENKTSGDTKRVLKAQLPIVWADHAKEYTKPTRNALFSEVKQGDLKRVTPISVEAPERPSVCRQIGAMAIKATRVQMRDWPTIRLFGCLCAFMAVVLSTGFSPYIHRKYTNTYKMPTPTVLQPWCPPFAKCDKPLNDIGLSQLLFFLNVCFGSLCMMIGARLLGDRAEVLHREAQAGISPLLTAVVKMTVDLFHLSFYTLMFIGMWVAMGNAGSSSGWCIICYSLMWAASGFGVLMGVVANPGTTAALSMVFALFFASFNGVYPPLPSLGGGAWLWDLSYTRWIGEAVYTHFTAHLRDVAGDAIQHGATITVGYTLERMPTDIGIVLALGGAFRILGACFFLRQVHKNGTRRAYVLPVESLAESRAKEESKEGENVGL